MQKKTTVSIICFVYNHEDYLEQCLSSLVSQKTNFNYEVIVHDDASTDSSTLIIKKFAEKYPDIIIPVFQTQNQYSKGVFITKNFILPLVRGEYVAFCDGDDYWIDEKKLQKQFEAIQNNSTCKLCVHRVMNVSPDGEPLGSYHPAFEIKNSCVINSDSFIRMVCESYAFQTSSYFMDAKTFRNYWNEFPEFIKRSPVGDQAYLLYFGDIGDVYYLIDVMSCYRTDCKGSFSKNFLSASDADKNKFFRKMIGLYTEYNNYTNNKYFSSCNFAITKYKYLISVNEGLFGELIKKQYRKLLKSENMKSKIYIYYRGIIEKIKERKK